LVSKVLPGPGWLGSLLGNTECYELHPERFL